MLSVKGLPTSCMPIGRPAFENPQETEIAGYPVRLKEREIEVSQDERLGASRNVGGQLAEFRRRDRFNLRHVISLGSRRPGGTV